MRFPVEENVQRSTFNFLRSMLDVSACSQKLSELDVCFSLSAFMNKPLEHFARLARGNRRLCSWLGPERHRSQRVSGHTTTKTL
jgi:hypothetical protein